MLNTILGLNINTGGLIATKYEVLVIQPNHTIRRVISTGVDINHIIEYDFDNRLIVVFQSNAKQIDLIDLNEWSHVKRFTLKGNPRHDCIAFDYINHFIFWIDFEIKSIKVLDINDIKNVYTICEVMSKNPRDLRINVLKSVLIWSSIGFEANLMESNLDGSNRTILYNNSRQAFHLTIDYQTNSYYFIDINDYSLISIDFNGNNEQNFMNSYELFHSLNSMFVLNRDLYLSNELMVYKIPEFYLRIPKAEVLFRTGRYGVQNNNYYNSSKTLTIDRRVIYGFKTLSPILRPNVRNRCEESHECQELCLPLRSGYRCLTHHNNTSHHIHINDYIDNNNQKSL